MEAQSGESPNSDSDNNNESNYHGYEGETQDEYEVLERETLNKSMLNNEALVENGTAQDNCDEDNVEGGAKFEGVEQDSGAIVDYDTDTGVSSTRPDKSVRDLPVNPANTPHLPSTDGLSRTTASARAGDTSHGAKDRMKDNKVAPSRETAPKLPSIGSNPQQQGGMGTVDFGNLPRVRESESRKEKDNEGTASPKRAKLPNRMVKVSRVSMTTR